MNIKPTKDMYGNRVQAHTLLAAIGVAKDSEITLDEVWKKAVIDVSLTIDTNSWVLSSGEGYAYYKEFEVPQILSSDNPIYTLVPTASTATDVEINAFNKISMIETLDGKVKVYVSEVPSIQIDILFKGIPNRLFEV